MWKAIRRPDGLHSFLVDRQRRGPWSRWMDRVPWRTMTRVSP